MSGLILFLLAFSLTCVVPYVLAASECVGTVSSRSRSGTIPESRKFSDGPSRGRGGLSRSEQDAPFAILGSEDTTQRIYIDQFRVRRGTN